MKGMLTLIVGCGGFIGAAVRYLVSDFCARTFKNSIPHGTWIVNIAGAIIIGFVIQLSLSDIVSPKLKLFVTTGICGGLTTFSTFSLESITLFANGKIELGILNVILNLFLSLIGVLIGQSLAKLVIG